MPLRTLFANLGILDWSLSLSISAACFDARNRMIGNLYVTTSRVDGVTPTLCLLDFGLIAHVSEAARSNMTRAIVNLLQGDYDALISRDAKDLGFLPLDMDVTEVTPVLKKILKEGLLESGSNLHDRKRNLMAISNELNEVFFRYPFRLVTENDAVIVLRGGDCGASLLFYELTMFFSSLKFSACRPFLHW
jgi:hypothetical protein